MVKAFGVIYLTEEEQENEKLVNKYVGKYPDTYDSHPFLTANPYEKEIWSNGFSRKETFEHSGYNRKQKRAAMFKRKFNTRGFPSGYGNHNTPTLKEEDK